ncbi:hypothetical protein CDD82_7556 [Ophiocordyceps australis]|uniref:Uncharacterized protein n=1 Tax=Ophiocordyceps australis TaxID=1399860 RepID=A0A2C5XEP5_9HYPO|nr:hypothetical protein CDD82_7556 [Ophiocordyceps australis]
MSHSSAATPSTPSLPPLLLTKRLVCFLRANQTAQLPTLLLTTASGKLLAHASLAPVTRLRTQATVAACLLAMHTAPVHAAQPAPPDDDDEDELELGLEQHDAYEDEDDSLADTEVESESELWESAPASRGHGDDSDARRSPSLPAEAPDAVVKPVTITVQISSSTVIIRRLACSLLLVAIGPPSHDAHHHQHSLSQLSQHSNLSKPRSRQDPRDDTDDPLHPLPDDAMPSAQPPADNVTAPADPDAASAPDNLSAHATTASSADPSRTASLVAVRKVAASLAAWLDDKLCTFRVPDEYGSLRLG